MFLTNEEDDIAVALPLIHGVDLVCSFRKAKPEVFDLSRIEGHLRFITLGPPELSTFPRKEREHNKNEDYRGEL